MPLDFNQHDLRIGRDELFLTSELLADVRHAVSTRHLIQAPNERKAVALRLREMLGWGELPLAMAEQVHGAEVAVIGPVTPVSRRLCDMPAGRQRYVQYSGADAIVCAAPGVMLAIVTADCVPILFADTEAGVIGAVHAGWRGSFGHILERALAQAIALGARPHRLRAWIAPAICGEEYEVSAELSGQFAAQFPLWAEEFIAGRHVDLVRLNALQAAAMGLPADRIASAGICTLRRADLLCSYRRDGANAGRMISAIVG